jgi:hypothetical protein
MITPARTKKGMASSENELMPRNICCAEVSMPFSKPRAETMARADDRPTATLMGAPRSRSPKTPTTRMTAARVATSMSAPPP